MLCLNRKAGESIVIDGNIEIKINKLSHLDGDPIVHLGIDAPKEISVHRKEVQEQIDREAGSPSDDTNAT